MSFGFTSNTVDLKGTRGFSSSLKYKNTRMGSTSTNPNDPKLLKKNGVGRPPSGMLRNCSGKIDTNSASASTNVQKN